MDHKTILKNGLWNQNAGLVQLLGLCPLLAVTNNATYGLGLGLATIVTLLATNVSVSAIRHQLRPQIRIPVFVLIIAASVTVIELMMNAWLHDLYLGLGIFLPLIVTNCAIIGRAEGFASRNSIGAAALDGLSVGLGFAFVLIALGGLRELLARGTIFADWYLLSGAESPVVEHGGGFLLAALPPGAFFGLALLIACKNVIDKKRWLHSAATKHSDMARSHP